MNKEPTALINNSLNPGEGLIWWGRPRQGVLFSKKDLVAIPLNLFLIFVIVFASYAALFIQAPHQPINKDQYFYILRGIWVACLLGSAAYLLLFPFIESWRRKNVHYCVTTKRLLVIAKASRKNGIFEIPLASPMSLMLDWDFGTRGNIVFRNLDSVVKSTDGRRLLTPPRFAALENPRQVFDLIRDARKAACKNQSHEGETALYSDPC